MPNRQREQDIMDLGCNCASVQISHRRRQPVLSACAAGDGIAANQGAPNPLLNATREIGMARFYALGLERLDEIDVQRSELLTRDRTIRRALISISYVSGITAA